MSDALDRLNAELELRTATCHCGREFKYEYRGVRRRSCPACIEANIALSQGRIGKRRSEMRRLRPGEQKVVVSQRAAERGDDLDRVAKMEISEIAKIERITPQRVQQLTRMAVYRIRSNAPLRRLWEFWLAEGSPTPKARRDLGEQLLEWELELGRWWAVHDILREAGCQEEANEAISELAKFQRMLNEAVTRLTGAPK